MPRAGIDCHHGQNDGIGKIMDVSVVLVLFLSPSCSVFRERKQLQPDLESLVYYMSTMACNIQSPDHTYLKS